MRLTLFLMALAPVGQAVAEQPHPVAAKLVVAASDAATRVGVLFEIEEGWHIYWKNPGESGLATSVDLDLPEAYSTGELQWPVPVSFNQPGDIAGYGYESSVLLFRDLVSLENRAAGGAFRARASWLACKDKCVQGEVEFSGSLEATPQSSEALFATWQECLPMTGEAAAAAVHRSTRPGSKPGEITLLLAWAQSPATVEVFPNPGDSLRITSMQTTTRGGLTRVDVSFRAIGKASSRSNQLDTLVVATDRDGRKRGYPVTFDIS